ncbi:MAG: glycosyltransferase, partial [Lachnospiraceae bacterium]|nr:glycosyltransferase [Lachnospiraceae bacterium]
LQGYGAKYVYEPKEFNFSQMCNRGAEETDGDFLLFLNDDIEICGEEWLSRLVGHAQLPHAGAVGCKLYYPGHTEIQHVGVLNLPIGPGHAFHHFTDADMVLYYGRNLLEYNFSAVTGACLMVDRQKFKEVGGFDESLPVAYNDVELCFKLIDAGYYNILRNDVVMIHHESVSRGYEDVSEEKIQRQMREMERLYELHPDWKGRDPFYNVNLTRDRGDFSFDIPL